MVRSSLFLIVTNKRDLTSDFIVREMRRRDLDFYRLNTEEIPACSFTRILGGATEFEAENGSFSLKSVRAAYFRRPILPEFSALNMQASSKHYACEEWSYLLKSIYLELGGKWFSHPNNISLAEDKPKQLKIANDIGFLVPETVITNKVDDVRKLFSGGAVVAKPLKQSLLEDADGPGRVIYTNTINSFSEIEGQELRFVPVIFQRKIEKELDIRVTVVGDGVFSAAIKSQEYDKTRTDWRHGNVIELEHEVFPLPQHIADKCKKIVKRLNLRFGAIDLVLDQSGEFWFLECNPNGQWAWIENRTGLPIAAAIVSAMEKISP